MNVSFVSGIDTDAGKTFATGYYAAQLQKQGCTVITQKMVQTGCKTISSDIEQHRRIMQMPLLPFDLDGTTCSYLFDFAASPHLAAQLAGTEIDVNRIDGDTLRLSQSFDRVLLEGAGGLFVPITPNLFIIDFIAQRKYPLILVSSARLGSINHTLLCFEACKTRGIELEGVFYNQYPQTNELIAADSRQVIQHWCKEWFPNAWFQDLPLLHVE